MKKTIQINIAGVMFNIEEEAYEKLSAYLRSIQQYFSNFEGSEEITSDIEARIAEKFINKQKTDNQSVITIESVNSLIKDMGTVADFEAIQENEDLKSTVGSSQSSTSNQNQETSSQQPKSQISRDTRRKALGGVLAGLAHYWNADIVWIRIAFLVLLFGLIPTGVIPGILFIGYFVAWIIFPPNDSIEDNPNIKKYYRDIDHRIIGGVSSGLASYFKTDVVIFRIIFVATTITGGLGLILYLILWIVAPTARTLTQKMEMKGEALTIENIESKIKENQNPSQKPEQNENTLSKIILFPFRMIGIILRGVGTVLSSLGPVVRVFLGLIMLLISVGLLIGFISSMVVFVGFTSTNGFDLDANGNLLDWILQDIHPSMGIFIFLAGFIPIIAIGMLGLMLLTDKFDMFNRGTWTGFLTAWLVGVVGTMVLAARYQINLSKHNSVEKTINFPLPAQTLWLDANEDNDFGDSNDLRFRSEVRTDIEGYEGNDLKLEQTFEARGRTREEAKKNAEAIIYKVVAKDSVLLFDEFITLPPKGRFRKQELKMKLYIPYNKRFKMTEDFYRSIYNDWHYKNDIDIDADDIDKFNFMIKKDSGIVCLDCPKLTEEEKESNNHHFDDDNYNTGYIDYEVFNRDGEFDRNFDLTGFESVQSSGKFIINIKKGEKFGIKAKSNDRELLNNIELKVKDNLLKIDFEDHFRNNNSDVILNITMPNFKGLNLSDKAKAKVVGFDDNKDVDINLEGSSRAAIDIEANTIDLNLNGVAKAELRGKAEKIDLNLTGECGLDARKMQINSAHINAQGNSRAKFGKVEKSFNANTSGASKVTRD